MFAFLPQSCNIFQIILDILMQVFVYMLHYVESIFCLKHLKIFIALFIIKDIAFVFVVFIWNDAIKLIPLNTRISKLASF